MTASLLLVGWLAAAGGSAAAEPSPTQVERCELPVKSALEAARRKGYEFRAEAVGAPTTCLIVDDNLVVSAKPTSGGVCRFELFVPPRVTAPSTDPTPAGAAPAAAPTRRPQVLTRIAIKPADAGEESWEQRGPDRSAGFTVERTAPKAQSVSYRISRVELAPVDGGCDRAKLEGKL